MADLLDMVVKAVHFLNQRRGSKRQDILKYVMSTYNIRKPIAINKRLKAALKKGVEAGALVQLKSGNFKLGPAGKLKAMEVAGDKEMKEDGGKTVTKGRSGKKATEEVPEHVEEKNGDDEEVHQKKAGKRAPAKKAAPRKGKQEQAAAPDTPDVDQKFNATFEVMEAVVEEEAIGKKPAKKGAKGKKAEAIAEESDENMGQQGDTVTADKMRSPEKMQSPKSPKAAAKSDGGDVVEGKKRGRKPAAASTGEENVAETVAAPAARRGPLKKAASASSGVEAKPEEDEEKEKDAAVNPRRAALKKTSPVPEPEGDEGKQEANADAKGGRGKRKKAIASEQPESGATTAVKPKRGRGAKAKKDVEEDEDA